MKPDSIMLLALHLLNALTYGTLAMSRSDGSWVTKCTGHNDGIIEAQASI